jgi:hypothetical protein
MKLDMHIDVDNGQRHHVAAALTKVKDSVYNEFSNKTPLRPLAGVVRDENGTVIGNWSLTS